MALTTKYDVPLACSATTLHVPPQAVDDGASAYGTYVSAGNGNWVLGSDMPKGRKLLVVVETGALTSTPTYLKVALLGGGTNTNGASGAEITSTVTEWQTPAGLSVYTTEIDLSAVSDLTKYYSLGLSSNGGGATSIIAGAAALVLDKTFI